MNALRRTRPAVLAVSAAVTVAAVVTAGLVLGATTAGAATTASPVTGATKGQGQGGSPSPTKGGSTPTLPPEVLACTGKPYDSWSDVTSASQPAFDVAWCLVITNTGFPLDPPPPGEIPNNIVMAPYMDKMSKARTWIQECNALAGTAALDTETWYKLYYPNPGCGRMR